MTDRSLTRAQRRRLLTALNSFPLFNTPKGRDLLLSDLPSNLVNSLSRSDSTSVDLVNIVRDVESWGMLADGESALIRLLDNALYHTEGSASGKQLQSLLDELTHPSTIQSRTAPLSNAEKAKRYRELKAAARSQSWQRMLELASGLAGYLDVDKLIDQANKELEQLDRMSEAVTKASAQEDWESVIHLANQLGDYAPSELAPFVAEAWREIPIPTRVLGPHHDGVSAVAITLDGHHALVGCYDGTFVLWDLTSATARQLITAPPPGSDPFIPGSNNPINAVVVTPDGRYGLAGFNKGLVLLTDLVSGSMQVLSASSGTHVFALALASHGQQVLVGSSDGTIASWDLTTNQRLRVFPNNDEAGLGRFGLESATPDFMDPVTVLVVLPDGRYVISGSINGLLIKWNLSNFAEEGTTFVIGKGVYSLALTSDRRSVLVGSGDGIISFLDVDQFSWSTRTFTPNHADRVSAIKVTPDGRHAVSGSFDGSVRLWDLASGQELRSFIDNDHNRGVNSIAISSDGRTIVAGSWDNLVRIWTLPPGLLGPDPTPPAAPSTPSPGH